MTSPDTAITNLQFSGASTNAALVSGINFTFNGSNMVAHVNLVANKSGTDFVTIAVTDGFSTSSKGFTLNVAGVVAPPSLKRAASGGKLTLSFAGTANASYGIQASTDLKTWNEVTTITADANGSASYTNSISDTVKEQFFRAVVK